MSKRHLWRACGAAAALLVGCAVRLPAFAAPVEAAAAAAFDVARYVDPEYRDIAEKLIAYSKKNAELSQATLADARKHFPSPWPHFRPAWSERMIPGPEGSPDVRIYIVNGGVKKKARPAILHMHGGGFVTGSAKASLRRLQELASALDCVIVSVDYRLAPEHRFPDSLEDNYAALKWLHDHAAELGADRSRIAVMGESAGGGHAAMLAIAARDRGEIPIVFQALVYPMLDDRTGSTLAPPPHVGTLVWTAAGNRFGWTSLLGVPAGSEAVPQGAVPARTGNLAGLPPAFIAVGDIDLFAREDVEYARRLMAAGVPTELHVLRGVPHAFDFLPGTRKSKQFVSALEDALASALTIERKSAAN